jgi:hypothetical protein
VTGDGSDATGRHDAPPPAEPPHPAPQDAPPPAEPSALPGPADGAPPDGGVDPVEPRLRLAFDLTPDVRTWVSVRFRRVPPAAELRRLGLQPTTENPVTGLLGRSQVLALAGRDDVEEIALRPEPTLT